jgi:predicted Zn finger-like uncharacterized protein
MAGPICPHCQSDQFALSTEKITGARMTLCVVRCASCNAPIGILQQEDPSETIRAVAHMLGNKLDAALGQLTEVRKELDSLKSRSTP